MGVTRIGATDLALEKLADALETTRDAITDNDYLRSVNVLIDAHDREDCPCIQLKSEIDLTGNLPGFILDVAIYVEREKNEMQEDYLQGCELHYYDNIKLIQNNIVVPTLFNNGTSSVQYISDVRVQTFTDNEIAVRLQLNNIDNIRYVRKNEARLMFSFVCDVSHTKED